MEKQKALFEYCLRLGDTTLVMGQRLSEWCGHGPILEEDIALTNISLDFIGHATAMLQYAGKVEGANRTEDELAYLRNEREFRNLLITEQPNGDYAFTIMRQFLFDAYSVFLYEALSNSKDETIAGISQKSLKEVNYHLRHSSEWVLRMGDGTTESHERVQNALDELWMFTGDMFDTDEVDALLLKEGIAADINTIEKKWMQYVISHLEKATLTLPSTNWMQKGSREGKHTEHLGFLLAEMQYLPRTFSGAKW